MNEFKKKVENIKGQMQQMRDEIQLKVHLGKADAKDEWARLEKKRQELLKQTEEMGEVVDETTQNLSVTLEMALEELKEGYANVRKKFKD